VTPQQSIEKVSKSNGNKCKYCLKGVLKGIFCIECQFWIHSKCARLNLNKIKDDDSWRCEECTQELTWKQLKSDIETRDKIILLLKKDIEDLKVRNAVLEEEKSEKIKSFCSPRKNTDVTSGKRSAWNTNCGTVIDRNVRNTGIPVNNKYEVLNHHTDVSENLKVKKDVKTSKGSSSGPKEVTSKYRWIKSACDESSRNVRRSVLGNKVKDVGTSVEYSYETPPKRQLSSKNEGALLIGDSILKHVEVKNTSNKVFSGIRLEQLCQKLQDMKPKEEEEHPKIIFLHAGTNNLLRSRSAEEVMGEMYCVIRKAKETFSRSLIAVNGILYRRDVNRRYIDEVNSNIRWACETLGALYCDVNKYVNDNSLGKDGLHLNRRGSYIVSKYIENVMFLHSKQGN
jgi:lysophospholipase L1-like esterase